MVRKAGKVYDAVIEKLRAEGMNAEDVEVASLCRGCDHLVLRDGETIGEYNHRSHKLIIYDA